MPSAAAIGAAASGAAWVAGAAARSPPASASATSARRPKERDAGCVVCTGALLIVSEPASSPADAEETGAAGLNTG